MRSHVFVTLVCLTIIGWCTSASAGEGTYIIVDAVAEAGAEQSPKWIAFSSRRSLAVFHLPVGKSMYSLKAKHARDLTLNHVDFDDHPKRYSKTTQHLGDYPGYELKIQKGKINYLGLITVHPEGENRHSIEWSEALLREACRKYPRIFETHMVAGRESEFEVDCSQILSQ